MLHETKCELYTGDGVDDDGNDKYFTCNNQPVVGHLGTDEGGVWLCQFHFDEYKDGTKYLILGWWQDP